MCWQPEKKHRPMKDNAYRQDIVTRTSITRLELITIPTVTIRSIWHNSAGDFFAFLQISAANLRILWRHLPTELRNVYCVAKHIWSSNKQRKQRPNPCIIGYAILPQTGTKWTKKRISKFGALLWRHLTPQRKPQHRCTTTLRPVYNFWKIRFRKIYLL